MVEENDLGPDLIISDVVLPEKNGRVVLHPGIPFLEKPFSKDQLLDKSREIFDGSKA